MLRRRSEERLSLSVAALIWEHFAPAGRMRLLADALKYSTKKEWSRGNKCAYDAARNSRMRVAVFRCCAHMKPLVRVWTDVELLVDAEKYSTRAAWQQDSRNVSRCGTQSRAKTF